MSDINGDKTPVDDYTTKVEEDLVQLIIKHLRANRIDLTDAEYLAEDFLSLLPAVKERKDLLNILQDLGEDYEEAREVFLKYAPEFERQRKEKGLEIIKQLLDKGRVDDALQVAEELNQAIDFGKKKEAGDE